MSESEKKMTNGADAVVQKQLDCPDIFHAILKTLFSELMEFRSKELEGKTPKEKMRIVREEWLDIAENAAC